MYIIKTSAGDVIGQITSNHSLTLDEAMDLIGYEWVVTDNDSGYLVGDVYYDESNLELSAE